MYFFDGLAELLLDLLDLVLDDLLLLSRCQAQFHHGLVEVDDVFANQTEEVGLYVADVLFGLGLLQLAEFLLTVLKFLSEGVVLLHVDREGLFELIFPLFESAESLFEVLFVLLVDGELLLRLGQFVHHVTYLVGEFFLLLLR